MPLLLLLWPRLLLVLLLGLPLLLAIWALFRLRSVSPAASPTSSSDLNQPATGMNMGRTYLLANYTVAVQLSSLQGKQALTLVSFLILFQIVNVYTALQALILWRSVPVGVLLAGVATVGWVAYRLVGPAVDKYFEHWQINATHTTELLQQRRGLWALLGYACFWVSFSLIFIVAILREYYL